MTCAECNGTGIVAGKLTGRPRPCLACKGAIVRVKPRAPGARPRSVAGEGFQGWIISRSARLRGILNYARNARGTAKPCPHYSNGRHVYRIDGGSRCWCGKRRS